MALGPFQPGDTVRIPLEVTLNGVPIAVSDPRVQRIILPNGTDASGYPVAMSTVKTGTYFLEVSFTTIGNYLVILQAELGTDTIEEIESFIIEKPFGLPRIQIACD